MATYQFSTLTSGQSIAFNPAADLLNFDQTAISAANLGVTQEGANSRVSVLTGVDAGKSVVLLNTSPLQLATVNVAFANGSALLFGDNAVAQNDNANNSLNGTSGNDLMQGFGGNDTFNMLPSGGSYGHDVVDGGAGTDAVDFSGSRAQSGVAVDLAAGTATGGAAGGGGSATLTSIENVVGTQFADHITGSAAGNYVFAWIGDDTIEGGAGVDTLGGGAGNDHFVFHETGTANADFLTDFTSGSDKIHLDASVMTALGAAGAFSAGDARFFAGTAAHDADDRVIYNSATRQIFYDADGNGSGAQQLIATLQSGATLVATDIVVDNGSSGGGGGQVINGTSGNDSLVGGPGNDTLNGFAGDDTLDGGGGTDTLNGGDGNDTYIVPDGTDTIIDSSGIDTMVTRNSGLHLRDGIENGILQGSTPFEPGIQGNAADNLIVNQMTDYLQASWDGFGGNDTLIGGVKTDLFDVHATSGNDSLDGGGGGDFLLLDDPGTVDVRNGTAQVGTSHLTFVNIESFYGSSGSDQLFASDAGSFLSGARGDDTLVGGAGNDTLAGDAEFGFPSDIGGNDSISGGAGNDFINAGSGSNTMDGGAGNDTLMTVAGTGDRNVFLFTAAPGAANADVIQSFTSGSDSLHLDATVMPALGPSGNLGSDGRFYAASGATGGHDPDDRVVYDTSTGNLYYDADGNGTGAAQLIATLQGHPTLAATDVFVDNGTAGSVINGTEGNDFIVGTDGNDTINGLGGDDDIEGVNGDDSLDGGTGNDVLIGQAGNDFLVGGDGNDILEGWTGADTLIGGAGDDELQSARSFADPADNDPDSLVGGDGNDTLVGSGADTLDGGAGNDVYHVYGGFNPFTGVLTDSGGVDTVAVHQQDWTLGAGFENLNESPIDQSHGGNWHLVGNGLDNVIDDSAMDQGHLEGLAGNDTLIGGSDGGIVSGGTGNDVLSGGSGTQFVFDVAPGSANADVIMSFDSSKEILLDASVMPALGPSGAFSSSDARFYAAAGVTGGHDADDRVVYNTSTGQLFYDADGSTAGAAQLIATLQGAPALNAMNIVVENGTGSSGAVINGTSGDDTLVGTSGNDTINGFAGNDAIDGRGGADSLVGGAGNDTLTGGVESNHGDFAADTLDGGLGDDTYFVAPDGDVILPDPGGIDTVHVQNGGWTLGPGLDNLVIDDSVGAAFTGTGNELDNVMSGSSEGGSLFGLGGNDRLIVIAQFNSSLADGGDGNDTLSGGEHTRLIGGTGNDSLIGGGSNELHGGAGNDTLVSGTGGTAFVFEDAPGAANADLVTGFSSASDEIRLDASVMTALGGSGRLAGSDSRFYANLGATSGHDADDRVVYDTGTGNLYYDADGNGSGASQLIATLQGHPGVDATRIVILNGATNQTINGTAGNDSLVGGVGNDTIFGFGGNDTLLGNAGDDSLDGGTGTDRLDGGSGNDTLSAGSFDNDTFDGGAGNDTLLLVGAQGGINVDLTTGIMAGGDAAGAARASLVNIEFVDASQISQPIDITGNDGGNYLRGGSSVDVIFGGGGDDTIYGAAFPDANANGDALLGGAGNDLLSAVGGNGSLDGGAGNDILAGGSGIDQFQFTATPGAANADSVAFFEVGKDKIHLDGSVMPGLGDSGNLAAGDARYFAAPGATGGHDADDRVVYDTTSGKLYYDADGNGATPAQLIATFQDQPVLAATDIVVDHSTANQTITGTAGNDSLVGGPGNDSISGLAGNDTLVGNSGDDTLDGGAGTDSMDGGDGNDTYFVDAATDVLTDSSGIDTVVSSVNWALAPGIFENLTLIGSATDAQGNNLDNRIVGNDLNDEINARAGNDTLFGMGGNDTFDFSSGGTSSYGNDVIDGGAGTDTIDFGGSNAASAISVNLQSGFLSGGAAAASGATLTSIENVVGTQFSDTVAGDSHDNFFYGWLGNDTLLGIAGNDSLNGADGNDLLDGGNGNDTLIGGAGADLFVFADPAGAANADRVTDFASGTDRLQFDNAVMPGLGANGNFAAGDARFYAAAGAGGGHDADDRLVYNTSTGQLFYDDDGSGAHAAQIVVTLQAGAALSATDISVI